MTKDEEKQMDQLVTRPKHMAASIDGKGWFWVQLG